ncbi:hypothetical protein, partial [Vreelandella gomseomensis]
RSSVQSSEYDMDTTPYRFGQVLHSEFAAEQPASSSIQRGLDSLREKGLVWRSGRGVYALEDSGMGEWLLSNDSGTGEDDPMQYSYVSNTLDRLDRDFLTQPHIVRPITAGTLSEALRLTDNDRQYRGRPRSAVERRRHLIYVMAHPSGGLADGMIETVNGLGDAEVALHLALESTDIVAVKFSTENYLLSAEC